MNMFRFLFFISLLLGSLKSVYAATGKKLNCLSISMSIIDDSLRQRFDDYDVSYIAGRIKKSAYNSQLRNAIPELKDLLQKPESEITAGELSLLHELQVAYEDREFGYLIYAKKIADKIQRIKNLQNLYADKIHFTRNSSKDLRQLSFPVKEKFENEILPSIINGTAKTKLKQDIPHSNLFVSFRSVGGYYIVAFEHMENGQIKVNMVGPHEGFYRTFTRRMGFTLSRSK